MVTLTSFCVVVVQAIVVALVLTIANTDGAKFLTTLFHPFGQASHHRFVGRITTGLVERGHSVTVLATDTYDFHGFNKDVAATRIATFKVTTPKPNHDDVAKKLSLSQNRDIGVYGMLKRLLAVNEIAAQNCADMFDDYDVMNDLRKQKFDLLLLEMFVPCDALLAGFLNVPFIVMTGSFRFTVFNEDMFNMEVPSSYVPFSSIGTLTDRMSFGQRVQNFVERHVALKLMQHIILRPFRRTQLNHNIAPTTSIQELIGRAELWLCHIDFALQYPQPTAPNWVMIAGLTVAEIKPLAQDLEDFMQGSGDHGVIVFSLGSMDMKLLSEQIYELFAQAFSELPQRVLWKHIGPPPRHLSNNTRLMSWIPQADLLAHPKTKLLFYHGGLAGVYEAIRFKKPMVILPLFADQPGVGARVANKGMGVVLSKDTLSVETIKSAIQQVLHDPSYKANVEKFGSISLDTLTSPMDTVMFWIEHIVKFGGSHLRSRAGELNLITLNSLDVIGFILAVVLFVLYLDFLVLRSCYRRCITGNKNIKTKSD